MNVSVVTTPAADPTYRRFVPSLYTVAACFIAYFAAHAIWVQYSCRKTQSHLLVDVLTEAMQKGSHHSRFSLSDISEERMALLETHGVGFEILDDRHDYFLVCTRNSWFFEERFAIFNGYVQRIDLFASHHTLNSLLQL